MMTMPHGEQQDRARQAFDEQHAGEQKCKTANTKQHHLQTRKRSNKKKLFGLVSLCLGSHLQLLLMASPLIKVRQRKNKRKNEQQKRFHCCHCFPFQCCSPHIGEANLPARCQGCLVCVLASTHGGALGQRPGC